MGHESVLEHATATFHISEISRAASHQLVRHRLASYSQQSQRYVKEDQFEYIIPDSITELDNVKGLNKYNFCNDFKNDMLIIQEMYKIRKLYKRI